MKKLIFTLLALIAVSSIGMAQLQTTKNYPKFGFQGALDAGNGDKKFSLNFNSTTTTLPYGGIANDGKGILSIALSGEKPVGKVTPLNNKKADNWGGNCNLYKFRNMTELMNFSVVDTMPIYSSVHQYWKPTNVIMNYPTDTTNQLLVAYPGMYKRVNLGFQAAIDGGGLKSDLSFEITTFDKGNSAKTAIYKMIVSVNKEIKFGSAPLTTVAAIDTMSAANVGVYRTAAATNDIWVIDNIYTTRTDSMMIMKKINVAEAIGVQPGYFNGKKVYVTLYSVGSAATDMAPGIYDPVIGIDNIEGVYGPVSWSVPTGAVTNAYINHNNGAPAVTISTDFSGGTPVDVPHTVESTIKVYLTDNNRAASLTVTEGNDGGGTNPKFTFAATGAVKAKAADGTFSIDVPYTFVPSDGVTKFLLTIPAPAAGTIVNDTLELALTVKNIADGAISAERLEITNGVRFYYNVSAKGTTITGVPANPNPVAPVSIYSETKSIVALNTTENVIVTNIDGRIIRNVNPSQAAKGIRVETGAYIVKTGNTIQKVLVK